jgi:hypothetical protein
MPDYASNDLVKISFNAVPRTTIALDSAAANSGLNRTDTLNRAVQIYSGITCLKFWDAFRLLLAERAAVRRFASESARKRWPDV